MTRTRTAWDHLRAWNETLAARIAGGVLGVVSIAVLAFSGHGGAVTALGGACAVVAFWQRYRRRSHQPSHSPPEPPRP